MKNFFFNLHMAIISVIYFCFLFVSLFSHHDNEFLNKRKILNQIKNE